MSIQNTQNRIEFLEALKRNLRKLLVLNARQATKLVSITFADKYDLTNPRDVGNLIYGIDSYIDQELKDELYRATGDSIDDLTNLGVSQTVNASVKTLGAGVLGYLDLGTRLAEEYKTSLGADGKRLSDRIWTSADKQSIFDEVYNSIKKGESNYQLAQNIEKTVTQGTPASSIKRVADTEMTAAYGKAKTEIARREMQDYPEIKTYVRFKLSPAHVIPDICDDLVGTYEIGEEPDYPFHPNCFLGDTNICASNISAKTVSKYDGDIIRITTAKGSVFSVTPNHPMLSTHGFVAANSLKEGDYLVRTGRWVKNLGTIKPNSKSIISKIKDVVIPNSMVFSRVPSPIDFHGDGIFYKKINIILANSELLDNINIPISKFANNIDFISRLVTNIKLSLCRSFLEFIIGILLAKNSPVGILGTSFTKDGIKFINSLLPLAISSYLDTISKEYITNPSPRDIKFLVERKFRKTSLISADKIVNIEIVHYCGDVYNLETEGHWYSAESIIAHNCHCLHETFIKPSSASIRTKS